MHVLCRESLIEMHTFKAVAFKTQGQEPQCLGMTLIFYFPDSQLLSSDLTALQLGFLTDKSSFLLCNKHVLNMC